MKTLSWIIVLCSSCCLAGTNELYEIVGLISSMRDDYGRRFPREGQIREGWNETMLSTNVHFRLLQDVVTNRWRESLDTLPSITNQGDRLIVMAAGAAKSEADYIERIGVISDKALSNQVSTAELIYYENRCYSANYQLENVFLSRYGEPAISNLILKVNAAGGIPSGVEPIFSGDEKRDYDAAVRSGLIGP